MPRAKNSSTDENNLPALPGGKIETRVKKEGVDGYNPDVDDKRLTLLMRIVLERGLMSKEIKLEKKVEWCLRGIPVFEGTKSKMWVQKEAKHPQTAAQLEKANREASVRITELQKQYAEYVADDDIPEEYVDKVMENVPIEEA